jgi:dTDP-glucose pyrophosphorylase
VTTFFCIGFSGLLNAASSSSAGAKMRAYPVSNPEVLRVVAFDERGIATSIQGNPARPKHRFAATSLFLYDPDVLEVVGRMGWIDAEHFRSLARPLAKSGYGSYLLELLDFGRQVDGNPDGTCPASVRQVTSDLRPGRITSGYANGTARR